MKQARLQGSLSGSAVPGATVTTKWSELIRYHRRDTMFTRRTRAFVLAVAVNACALAVGVTTAGAADGGNYINAHLCQQGGWQKLVKVTGEGFSNTGDCVSYAARGGDLSPIAQFQAICEEAAGTFVTDLTSLEFLAESDLRGWGCAWNVLDLDDSDYLGDTFNVLFAVCSAAGGLPIYTPTPFYGVLAVVCVVP